MEIPQKKVEDPYLPEGWNRDDLKAASMQWNAFMNTDAFTWIGHYLGSKQRLHERGMAPNKPSDKSYEEYIELASRVNEINTLWAALHTLSGFMNVPGKDDNAKG